MDFYPLNGLTPQQLHALIINSPIGFSAENGSIQYLGQQIQLCDGSTMVSGEAFSTDKSKELFQRLVTLQPDLETQLPGSKADSVEMVAKNLVTTFSYDALEKSPTKEVQFAVLIECLKKNLTDTLNKLSIINSLHETEKLQLFLAATEKLGWQRLSGSSYLAQFFSFDIRLKETKNLFQRLPDKPALAEEDKIISEYMTELQPDLTAYEGLTEIREFFKSENNDISSQLLSEVDTIKKKFIPTIEATIGLPLVINLLPTFNTYTRRLLYLYAACSGFTQKADIAELTSYIRSVLYCTTDSYCVWHIARELAYLSKQPGSIDYCRYIQAVTDILKTPENIALKFQEVNQLSDIKGFALLESHKTLAPYLAALRANIGSMIPEYSPVLLPEVDRLERKFPKISLPQDKPDIKATVHRLLLVIAACRSSRPLMATSMLTLFVRAIMKHGNKANIPYLISGLARLVQGTAKIQQILGRPGVMGGDHLRMAPLQLLAFVPDIISENDLEQLCKSLQSSCTRRRLMKDGKVFHQWLATLEQVLASKDKNKAIVRTILKKLTQSLTYEKLGLLYMAFKLGTQFNQFLESFGFSGQKERLELLIAEEGVLDRMGIRWHQEGLPVLITRKGLLERLGLASQMDGLPLLIAEKGVLEPMGLRCPADRLPLLIAAEGVLESMNFNWQKDGLPLLIAAIGVDALEEDSKEASRWLVKQRYFHLLPLYLASITHSVQQTPVTDLIHEFIKACVNNTFIRNRQSPLDNRHLRTVYKKAPELEAGWRANFPGFSKETRDKLVSPKETLELTEDPWDLFISGHEVNTCQSPNSCSGMNGALMSYVMDGRNAMIVKKNKNGNILSRSIIRLVLDHNDHPALFLEKSYPEKSDLLFIDAAREIAAEMKLPLYHFVDREKNKLRLPCETVKFLEGRAPVDYFDASEETGLTKRKQITLTQVQLDTICSTLPDRRASGS